MKVWITKYALTTGLFEIDAEIVDGTYASQIRANRGSGHFTREWTRTREEALVVAENMRKKRIASLEKSIKKLQKLRFITPGEPR